MQLASRFAPRSPVLRADHPLSDDQIRTVAPSIFADTPHESRSERYSYIPTAAVLTELRREGFQPFMVCQTRVRHEDRRDYTKHMLRLRHASQINGAEANEIILLNSHDGTTADAQDRGPATKNSSPPLIVVEDKGGTSALPYYRALNPQDAQPGQPATPQTKPRIGGPAEAEAAMLPVRSMRLTPGDEPRRVIRAPGLTPLFLIGDDDRSRAWLQRRGKDLQALRAVGLVVNVATPEALAALRRLAPGLMLSPASGDELAQRLGLKHYPVLITATGIEP